MGKTFRDIRQAKRKRLHWKDWPRELDDPKGWTAREPSWWHQETTHQPARADAKAKMHNVLSGRDEDDGNWPDHKKPHVYYW